MELNVIRKYIMNTLIEQHGKMKKQNVIVIQVILLKVTHVIQQKK